MTVGKKNTKATEFLGILKNTLPRIKNYTREESGAHLKISFWHLLLNLKNKYLLKKCWNGPRKSKIILIFAMLHLKKKINKHQKISLFYTCVPKILMIWPTVQRYRVWQTEIGSFRLCFALLCSQKCQKSKFWKNGKIPRDIIILHMCTEITIIWSMVPKVQSETDRIFWHFGLSFTPLTPQKSTFWKFKRNTWILHILQMCTINDNHMMYGSWDMEHNRQNFC